MEANKQPAVGVELDFLVYATLNGKREAAEGFLSMEVEDLAVAIATPRRYSTDLNAAFKAAEQVGLFDDKLLTNQITWEVVDYARGDLETFAKGDTPAEAICRAILRVKKQSNIGSAE